MKRILLISVIVLIGAVSALSFSLKKERVEVARLTRNQRSLLEDVTLYRTKDSLSAASVERLQLTNKEFEKCCADLKEQVSALGLKVRQLQSISSTGIETDYEVNIPIKDSVAIRDSAIILKCLELHTPYIDVSGCIERDRFIGNILSRDTLDQVVHRVPYQFWFIRWGCKAIQQEVVSRNPYTQITFSKYIELK